ncbi:hypothetical protein, partial [Acinetobacter baumannii]
ICEAYAIQDATDISHFGGWRAYIQSLNQTAQSVVSKNVGEVSI